MNILKLFGIKGKTEPVEAEETTAAEEMPIYSGMRVEVTTSDEQMLFMAKLRSIYKQEAELDQYSKADITLEEEDIPLRIKIRGYNEYEKKAVYLEGLLSPKSENKWKVEELTVVKMENTRSFFRLPTNLDATMSMVDGSEIGETPCKLVNISAGGACISSEYELHPSDKFLLKVRLLADKPESAMLCEVLRIIKKEKEYTHYGCQFTELTEIEQNLITQDIFTIQRKKRGGV